MSFPSFKLMTLFLDTINSLDFKTKIKTNMENIYLIVRSLLQTSNIIKTEVKLDSYLSHFIKYSGIDSSWIIT